MKNNDIKVLSRGCKIMYAVYLFAVIFFAGVYELLPEARDNLWETTSRNTLSTRCACF